MSQKPTQKGHSSYLGWRVIKNRAVEKIIPSLGAKSRAQLIFSAILIILAIFGTIGFGIYLDGYVIHPPKQYSGICPPPAIISHNGGTCTISQVQIVTSGTVTKATTIQLPAGQIIQTQTTVTKTVTQTAP